MRIATTHAEAFFAEAFFAGASPATEIRAT
jgi:hypothetical protein